ncbi:MAG: agmatinase [Ruminococcus sp.]|nr:agmatinase [Ruminococcus sp.]
MNKNVSAFIGCEAEYDDSRIVIFGAPYDSTTSFRPGTRFASSAIRNESFGIETYSPYQDKDLLDTEIFDSGDIELCFGNSKKALDAIEERTAQILSDGKIPCMIGGEHLVTLGAFRAVQKKYSDVAIVHFDAHADLREDYLGEKLSHASVIRRCHDIVGDGRIYQFGIRSGERAEFEFAKEHTTMTKFVLDGTENLVEKLGDTPVYFTLDLDVLDPSCFCGTGTPEAGGVTFNELMKAIKDVSQLNIVGFDMNELSPIYDHSGASTAMACKLMREILLYFYKG